MKRKALCLRELVKTYGEESKILQSKKSSIDIRSFIGILPGTDKDAREWIAKIKERRKEFDLDFVKRQRFLQSIGKK